MTANVHARLAVVGIGDDGWAGLGEAARQLVRSADALVGGGRHLALVPDIDGQERIAWRGDATHLVDGVLRRHGGRVVVLASGDPMFYGIGALLAKSRAPGEIFVLPAPSSVSLAAAALGWPIQETRVVSACGRPLEALHAELFDGARILLLSADGTTPAAAAALLRERGFGGSEVAVLEHLGGSEERIVTLGAAGLARDAVFAALNLFAIHCKADPDARIHSQAPGLPEEAYESDGQITKRETRAVTLARLSPRPGELLWDIGAGSGSIGIEWMRAARGARAIGIEDRPDRADRARRNARSLGVPWLLVVEGRAPEALEPLPTPDAVFVGGGLAQEGVFEAAWEALRPGGRLVANAVSLEGETRLLSLRQRYGGEICRLQVTRAEPLGGMSCWRPLMPVTQWSAEKPRP